MRITNLRSRLVVVMLNFVYTDDLGCRYSKKSYSLLPFFALSTCLCILLGCLMLGSSFEGGKKGDVLFVSAVYQLGAAILKLAPQHVFSILRMCDDCPNVNQMSDWWRYFLNLLVFCLFVCFFLSCEATVHFVILMQILYCGYKRGSVAIVLVQI